MHSQLVGGPRCIPGWSEKPKIHSLLVRKAEDVFPEGLGPKGTTHKILRPIRNAPEPLRQTGNAPEPLRLIGNTYKLLRQDERTKTGTPKGPGFCLLYSIY